MCVIENEYIPVARDWGWTERCGVERSSLGTFLASGSGVDSCIAGLNRDKGYHQIIGHVPGSLPILPSLLRSVMIGVGL